MSDVELVERLLALILAAGRSGDGSIFPPNATLDEGRAALRKAAADLLIDMREGAR